MCASPRPRPTVDETVALAVLDKIHPTDPLPDGVDDRVFGMVLAYAQGGTLRSIGESVGMTGERVRQLINRTPWTMQQLKAVHSARRRARDARIADEIRAWSASHPGVPLDGLAAEYGWPLAEVARVLGRQGVRSHHKMQRPPQDRRRSELDIITDIRAYAATCEGAVTGPGFSAWAREQGVPGSQTAGNRFGSWNAALKAAGLEPSPSRPQLNRFTTVQLWAALIQALRDDPSLSLRRYTRWRETHPAAPTLRVLMHGLDRSWGAMRDEALAVIAGTSEADPEWVAQVCQEHDWAATTPVWDDPVQVIAEAIEARGPHITSLQYAQWASANGRPASHTLMNRSGLSWRELVAAAGGTPANRNPAHLEDDELIAALGRYVRSTPAPSVRGYLAWSKENSEPSFSTIRRRLGSWDAALNGAAAGDGQVR